MELMIATAVFSVILLVCLSAIVYVGRLYYKGLAVSQTQSAARDAVNSIGDAVKFSRESVSYDDRTARNLNWDGYVCVGSRKYSYKIGQVLVDNPDTSKNQTTQALVESTDPDCGGGSVSFEPRSDNTDQYPNRELLGEFMRLNEFLVVRDPVTGLVSITVSIAFGGDGDARDSELFNTEPVGYTSGIDMTVTNRDVVRSCKTGVPGGQFCALSNLSKTVLGVQ